MGLIRGCVRLAFMGYFNLFYNIDVQGLNNIPKDGGYILVSNHIHWMDPILYVCENRRMVYAIAKEELFSTKLKAFIMRRLGLIEVKRNPKDNNTESINEAVQKLKEGQLLLIYPEGTRFGLKKGIKPKKGVALMAMEAKVPIIPMAMVGSFVPFTKIKIKIDKPMDISEFYPKDGENPNLRNMVKLTNNVMTKVIELRDEINTEEIEAEMNEAEEKREIKKQMKLAKKEQKALNSTEKLKELPKDGDQ